MVGQVSEGYAYDVADRLTRVDTSSGATRLEYDAASQLGRTVDVATGNVRATFRYDELGNRTTVQPAGVGGLFGSPAPTNYAYDQADRLTHVHKTSTSLLDPSIDRSYAYTGDGLRADLLWDHAASLPLILADAEALYVTGPDGLPLEQPGFDGTRGYYHHDELGSTRALTTTAGTVASRSDYDAYGVPRAPVAAGNPFGFAGQYTDRVTGLVYMRARWYDPATGQFITADPLGHASGETNLYRYAAGDPINLIDPTGLSVLDAIASLDNPVSQAVAGALNSALLGAPARIFGFDAACVGGAFDFGSTYLSLAVPIPGGKLAAARGLAAKAESRVWPKTADEMDDLLGFPGTRKPDGPMTPGRNKVEWRPNSNTKITYEQHPYHPDAPDWHRGPHWHLDTPGNPHQRHLPGDPIPGD